MGETMFVFYFRDRMIATSLKVLIVYALIFFAIVAAAYVVKALATARQ